MSISVVLPFQLDSTGAIQKTSNDDKALSDRVRALVSTVPGERLMRTDYGVPTPNALFDPNIADMVFAELKMMAVQAIRRWEPAAVVVDIQPVTSENSGSVALDVRVGRADVPNAELNRSKRVFVTVGGSTFDAGN